MVVSGALVSTVQDRESGEASMLPAASPARTWNVCAPCDEAGVARRAGAEAGAVERALERHAGLVGRERERGGVELTAPLGPPVIVVVGALVSTVQDRESGEPSMLPAASRARTWKVCAPCDSPV